LSAIREELREERENPEVEEEEEEEEEEEVLRFLFEFFILEVPVFFEFLAGLEADRDRLEVGVDLALAHISQVTDFALFK